MSKCLGAMQLLAAGLSGVLVAGCFAPFDFSFLIWVAMVPLLWALAAVEGRRVVWKGLRLGLVAGGVSCLIQFRWLGTVSWLAAVLLPLYLACFWAVFGAFATTLGRVRSASTGSSVMAAFCQAAVWAGLEWLRGWLFTGFGWNGLGVALHEMPTMAQGADLLGVTGLSLVLVFSQVLLVNALRGRAWRRWDLATTAALLGGLFFYGKFRISHERQLEAVRVKALLVQLNIPQDAGRVLWTDPLEIHQALEEETLKGLEGLKSAGGERGEKWPDWVLWPECALTGRILQTKEGEWDTWQINIDTIGQVRRAGPFSLIYGVNELEAERVGEKLLPKENGRAYNSIAVMTPDDALETYRKRHLVIFGETIPFVDSVPFLKEIYEQQSGTKYGGSFTPGESLEPLPIQASKTVVGAIPTVCFEDSVGRLTRKFVREGPQVIVNVTNDGWFKESEGAAQHFANARFRCIELRRPMLRSANTGVSAAVDTTGSTAHPDTGVSQVLVDEKGSHFTRGSRLVELKVPLRPSFSLFAVIGDWGILALAGMGIFLPLWSRRKRSV